MTKYALIAIATLFINGCGKPAESITQVNSEFKVDKLFTHEGCTVYRFRDAGKYRYYINCNGTSMSTKTCGKCCVREENISG